MSNLNFNKISCFFCRLSGTTTALGSPGGGNGGGNTGTGGNSGDSGGPGSGGGGGGGGEGATGNTISSGDFLRRSHPLSEHTALHPAYRLNYMDHLYHQLQASSHSPNASLHGNCTSISTYYLGVNILY